MNLRKLIFTSFLAVCLVLFLFSISFAGDDASKTITGSVVCLDKAVEECSHASTAGCPDKDAECSHASAADCPDKDKKCCEEPESASACCGDCPDEKANVKFGLKTSDGKVYPFAENVKAKSTINLSKYVGKNVEISWMFFPVSKTIHYSDLKVCDSKAANKECSSKSKTSSANVNK